MKNYLFLLLSAQLLMSCQNQGLQSEVSAVKPKDGLQKVDSLLDRLASDSSFFGSIAFLKEGQAIYQRSIGPDQLQTGKSAQSNTPYRVASITKSFTATLVFKAIEAQKLSLEQSIASFFPELKGVEAITIAHLLHHQSGIPSYTKDSYFWEHRLEGQRPDQLLAALSKFERHFEPGTDTEYSNSNYFLLSLILEQVYAKSYAALVESQILSPLNLSHTSVGDSLPGKDECRSYHLVDGQWQEFPGTHLSLAMGSGSMLSTPQDLNTFFRALVRGELVNDSSLKAMQTIIGRHGMGLFKYDILDQQGFGHGGNIEAFTAQSIYFPEMDLALSICSNGSTTELPKFYSDVLELYLGEMAVPISEEELKLYVGSYIPEDEPDHEMVFEMKDKTLIHVIKNEFRTPLIHKGNRRFLFNQMYGGSINFTFSDKGDSLIFEQGNYRGVYRRKM